MMNIKNSIIRNCIHPSVAISEHKHKCVNAGSEMIYFVRVLLHTYIRYAVHSRGQMLSVRLLIFLHIYHVHTVLLLVGITFLIVWCSVESF